MTDLLIEDLGVGTSHTGMSYCSILEKGGPERRVRRSGLDGSPLPTYLLDLYGDSRRMIPVVYIDPPTPRPSEPSNRHHEAGGKNIISVCPLPCLKRAMYAHLKQRGSLHSTHENGRRL